MKEKQGFDEIYIIAVPEEDLTEDFDDPMRGPLSDTVGKLRPTKVKLAELAGSVKLFMQQMEKLLSETPTNLGEFEFSEFEVSAGITTSGQLTLYGVAGAEIGGQGGLKFVFRKNSLQT